MCGRYTLNMEAALLAERFGIHQLRIPITPRYNIAPSQMVPVIHSVEEQGETFAILDGCSWGFASPPKTGTKGQLIVNARMEGLFERQMFKKLLVDRRCLIPADGFYTWTTENGKKIPYLVRLKSKKPFFFAGLWKEVSDKNKLAGKVCIVITVPANDQLSEIESRMPAILRPEDEDKWIDLTLQDKAELLAMLNPYPSDEMEYFRVSKLVNSTKTDDVSCARPLTGEEEEKRPAAKAAQLSLFDPA